MADNVVPLSVAQELNPGFALPTFGDRGNGLELNDNPLQFGDSTRSSFQPLATNLETGNEIMPSNDLSAEISGTVWNDLNGDGVRGLGEFGLANRTVFLDQNQNSLLDTDELFVTTGTDGTYRFSTLAGGIYTLAQVTPAAWQPTFPIPPIGTFQTVELDPGEIAASVDFGSRSLLSSLALNLNPQFSGFDRPVYLTHAGDTSDRLFVVEQPGQIRIVQNGTVLPTPFLDIRERVLTGGEQGLLSVAFPAGYADKQHFYVYYTNRAGNIAIARYSLTSDPNVADPTSEQIILTIDHPNFTNHNGGQLAFGADGFLYIGTGDGGGGGDPSNNAQNPNSLLGKILRIDVETPGTTTYTIPTTNPFVAATDPNNVYRDEIWALGLRNPWRLSFDRQTNDLYIADVGQNAVEEVNMQLASSLGGENYGWRFFEGSQPFNAAGSPPGLTFPVAEYAHSQGRSITGGYVYRGLEYSALQGVYLYGDFISGNIWALRRSGTGWENQLLQDTSLSISSFGEDAQGNLYLANYSNGTIYKVGL
ncbi:MAG: PQQ-dependent sugar dehydrogenase [Leptolyngbyaceae cyanobacterium bins.302]|nr:PQQ-dependent sugar dehydrogenase [Leptolyngbyaceae cyanobacterium bins.302]